MASPSPQVEKDFNLRTICDALGDIATKWFKVGIQLGIPRNKLLEFEEERDPLSAVIDYWLRGNVPESSVIPISWKSIATALKSKYVGEPSLAKEINNKYCPQDDTTKTEDTTKADQNTTKTEDDESSLSSDQSSLDSDVELDLKHQLDHNDSQIQEEFAFYVTSVQTIVEEKGVTVKNLSVFLMNLSASTADSEKKFKLLADLKAELKSAEDIADIFILLSLKYASHLNPNIYASILKKYGSKEEQKELDYPERLKDFIQRHKIKEFVKMYPELANPKLQKLDDNSKTIRIKLNISRTQSLSTLQEVTGAVANVLGLRPSTLRLYGVKKGCVLVTLLIPTSIADALFTRDTVFSPEEKGGFRAAKVLWLECNDHKFDLREKDEPKDTPGTVNSDQDAIKTDQDATKTPGGNSPRPGGVEKVRKQLMGIYTDVGRLASAQATPLHSAVESCDTDNVRNLLKAPEVKLQTTTVKPKSAKALLSRFLEKLTGGFQGSNILKRLSIFKRVVRNLYIDGSKFETISATPLHRATESHDVGKVREVLGQAGV